MRALDYRPQAQGSPSRDSCRPLCRAGAGPHLERWRDYLCPGACPEQDPLQSRIPLTVFSLLPASFSLFGWGDLGGQAEAGKGFQLGATNRWALDFYSPQNSSNVLQHLKQTWHVDTSAGVMEGAFTNSGGCRRMVHFLGRGDESKKGLPKVCGSLERILELFSSLCLFSDCGFLGPLPLERALVSLEQA